MDNIAKGVATDQTTMNIALGRLSNLTNYLDDQAAIFSDQIKKLDISSYKPEEDVNIKNPVPKPEQESIIEQMSSLLNKLERIIVRIDVNNEAFRRIV